MARPKKSSGKRNTNTIYVEDLSKLPLTNLLSASKEYMMNYGSLTVENRALPDYRDGCKPVYRCVLYAAYRLGKHHNTSYVKCARIVGDTIGIFHPHGDSAAYGALVTIANMQEPLLDKHGNFGSPDGDGAAAQRYTECRLSKYSDTYLLDPNYLAVTPMVENYDGTTTMPVYLPSKLPNVLITGAEGIAMGCTTLIPSFSKESVIELVISALKTKNKKCTAQMCVDNLEFKFSHGGKSVNTEKQLLEYYDTGTASLIFAPQMALSEKNNIRISSLAPRLKPSTIIDTGGKISGVKECRNIKGRDCEDWAEFVPNERNLSKQELKQLASKIRSKFATTLHCKTLVTERQDDGTTVKFKRTSIVGIVNDWISWRLNFEVKVVNRLIEIEKEKIQRWNWLLWAIDHLELIFKALKTTDPDGYLIKKGKITEEHAKYILDQQTRRLSKLSGDELKAKVKASKKIVVELKNDISNKDNISKRVIKGLKELS